MGNKKVYNNPKFTTKRGNIFSVNFRLPDGSFFRRSLGTDSLKTAEATMARLAPYIPLVQNGAMSVEKFQKRVAGLRELTQRELDQLLLNVLDITIADTDLTRPDNPYKKETSFQKQAREAEQMAAAMRQLSITMDESKAREILNLDSEYIIPEEMRPTVLEKAKKLATFHDLQFQAIGLWPQVMP